MNIHHGLSVREALIVARELGVEVTQRRRTDDYVFKIAGRLAVQSRGRKSINRWVCSLLHRAQRSRVA